MKKTGRRLPHKQFIAKRFCDMCELIFEPTGRTQHKCEDCKIKTITTKTCSKCNCVFTTKIKQTNKCNPCKALL